MTFEKPNWNPGIESSFRHPTCYLVVLLFLAMGVGVLVSPAVGQGGPFDGFPGDLEDWVVEGDAEVTEDGDRIIMTGDSPNQAGIAFFDQSFPDDERVLSQFSYRADSDGVDPDERQGEGLMFFVVDGALTDAEDISGMAENIDNGAGSDLGWTEETVTQDQAHFATAFDRTGQFAVNWSAGEDETDELPNTVVVRGNRDAIADGEHIYGMETREQLPLEDYTRLTTTNDEVARIDVRVLTDPNPAAETSNVSVEMRWIDQDGAELSDWIRVIDNYEYHQAIPDQLKYGFSAGTNPSGGTGSGEQLQYELGVWDLMEGYGINGHVGLESGSVDENVTVEVTIANETGSWNDTITIFEGLTDAFYSIDGLEPGTYEVSATVTEGNYAIVEPPIEKTIEADDIGNSVDFTLDETGSISGSVLDTDGVPVDSDVTIETDEGREFGTVTPDSSTGAYTLSDIPVGTYNLTATAEGYHNDTVTGVTVTADTTTTAVDFVLEQVLGPPTFVGATITDDAPDEIELAFNQSVNVTGDTAGFSVVVDGDAVSATAASNGSVASNVTLALAEAVTASDNVSLSYDGVSDNVVNQQGVEALPFSVNTDDDATFRNEVEPNPAEFVAGTISDENPAEIEVAFDQAVNVTEQTAGFTVLIDGVGTTVSNAANSTPDPANITLEIAKAVAAGQNVSVSYDGASDNLVNENDEETEAFSVNTVADANFTNAVEPDPAEFVAGIISDENPDEIELEFDQAVNVTEGTAGFTVEVDGTAVSLTGAVNVSMTATNITLELDEVVVAGQNVSVSYDGASDNLVNENDEETEAFSVNTVADANFTNAVEPNPAEFVAGTIDDETPDEIELEFDQAVNVTAGTAGFTVTVDGTPVTLTGAVNVSMTATNITLELAVEVAAGENVLVSYDGDSDNLVNENDEETEAFSVNTVQAANFTNGVEPDPAELVTGTIRDENPDKIELAFDQAVNVTEGTAGFTVEVDGNPVGLTTADNATDVAGNITLEIAEAVAAAQNVSVSYDGASDNLVNENDEETEAFSVNTEDDANFTNAVEPNPAEFVAGSIDDETPDEIELEFDQPVNVTDGTAGFTVEVEGSVVSLTAATNVSDVARNVTLGLAEEIAAGANVSVSYDGTSDNLVNENGEETEAFSVNTADEATFTNEVQPDPAEFVAGTIDDETPDEIELEFDQPVNVTAGTAGFTVTVDGTPVTLTGAVNVSDVTTNVTLELANVVVAGQNVSVSYDGTSDNLVNENGEETQFFSVNTADDATFTNEVQPDPAEFVAGTIDDETPDEILLEFDQAVNVTEETAGFTVLIDGVATTVTETTNSSTQPTNITLSLAAEVAAGANVSVSYDGASDNLVNENDEETETFSVNTETEVNFSNGVEPNPATFVAATITDEVPDEIELAFNQAVNVTAGTAGFSVELDGTPVTVTGAANVSDVANNITLEIDEAIIAGQNASISYDGMSDNLVNEDAEETLPFTVSSAETDDFVNAVQPDPATFVAGTIREENPDEIVLEFDQPVNVTDGTAGFTVEVDGTPVSLTGAENVTDVATNITLEMADAVAAGANVSISYDGVSDNLLNENEEETEAFSVATATHPDFSNEVAPTLPAFVSAFIAEDDPTSIEIEFNQSVNATAGADGFAVTLDGVLSPITQVENVSTTSTNVTISLAEEIEHSTNVTVSYDGVSDNLVTEDGTEASAFTVNSNETDDFDVGINPVPATLELLSLDIAGQGTGATIAGNAETANQNVSVEVNNTGGTAGTFDPVLEITGEGETVTYSKTVDLAAGENETVTFEDALAGLAFGVYDVSVTIDTETATGLAANSIDVNGNGHPATDTTGDFLMNDITGGEAESELTIVDVQVLFEHLHDDIVQEASHLFDFAGLDDDRVSIFDVQGLFNQYQKRQA